MEVVHRSQNLHLKKKQNKALSKYSNLYIVGEEKNGLMNLIRGLITKKN